MHSKPSSMTALPGQRALVRGLRKWTDGDGTHTASGEQHEATLVSRIGNERSSCWFVRFDGETVTRSRQIVRIIE